MTPFLSVVTPIYNSTETLKQYLRAVFASEYKDFELIIVDDTSDDNPQELIGGYNAIYKKLDRRSGSAYARNKGVELASGQILLFVDPDVIIRPDTLGEVASFFKSHPDVSGLICSYDDSPAAKNVISQFKFLFHHYIHNQEGEYVASFWTGCGAIKKVVFEGLGGFDTSFFRGLNTINDIEFGYRLKYNNHRIYNAKHIQVKHLKKLNFREWLDTDVFNRGLPWVKIMLAYRDFSFKLNLNANSFLSVLCVWTTVVSVGLSLVNKSFFPATLISLGVFLIINYKLINFFAVKKGILFSAISIPLLLIYYLFCGLSAVFGLILYPRI